MHTAMVATDGICGQLGATGYAHLAQWRGYSWSGFPVVPLNDRLASRSSARSAAISGGTNMKNASIATETTT